jgi:hypothetical protein
MWEIREVLQPLQGAGRESEEESAARTKGWWWRRRESNPRQAHQEVKEIKDFQASGGARWGREVSCQLLVLEQPVTIVAVKRVFPWAPLRLRCQAILLARKLVR